VEFAGEGLVIAVILDDPSDRTAIDAVIAAIEQAAVATHRRGPASRST
jgi:hypothetical protein